MKNLAYLAARTLETFSAVKSALDGEMKAIMQERHDKLGAELLEQAPKAVDVFKCPNCKRQESKAVIAYATAPRLCSPSSPEIEWDEVLICPCGTVYKIVNGA